MLLQVLDQAQEPVGFLALDPDRVLRQPGELGLVDIDPGLCEGLLNHVEVAYRRGQDVRAVLGAQVLGPGRDGRLEDRLFRETTRVHVDLTLAFEHPGHRAGLAQVASRFLDPVTNLGHGSVRVVGHALEQESHTAGAVAFVSGLLEAHPRQLAGAPLDRAVDVRCRHVHGFRGCDRRAQAGVEVRVSAPQTRGHGDLPPHLAESPPASGIRNGLLTLDLRPFAVSRQLRQSPMSRLRSCGHRSVPFSLLQGLRVRDHLLRHVRGDGLVSMELPIVQSLPLGQGAQ